MAEGVDVPALDGVAFIDPKGSQVEIIQAVGRAIRKVRGAKAQTKGTIIIPVFIEDGDDPETSIEASNFKPVWDVLKALRAHDEILSDELDQYRTNMAKNTNQIRKDISDKVIFDIPSNIDIEFSNALRTVIVERCSASWEYWYGLLLKFKEREGHIRVRKRFNEGHYRLGEWVSMQRRKKGMLSNNKIARLNNIGFIWDAVTAQWEEGFSYLEQYKKNEGHCIVPNTFKTDGFLLGAWVSNLRTNKNSTLEQIERLNALGFVWEVLNTQWDTGFNYLDLFHKREGHCKVPNKHKEGDFNLGRWVVKQRADKEKLSSDRRSRLDSLKFRWDIAQEQWEIGMDYLIRFYKREGHCRVPAKFKEDQYRLGRWVSRQRANKANNSNVLSPKQIEQLDTIGFIWDPHESNWQEGLSYLITFSNREGHINVPARFKEGDFNLGNWVRRQLKGKNTMSRERLLRLEDLGFNWDV